MKAAPAKAAAVFICALAFAARADVGAAGASPGGDGGSVLYPHSPADHPVSRVAPTGWGAGATTFLVMLLGAGGGWMLWKKLRTVGPTGRGERRA